MPVTKPNLIQDKACYPLKSNGKHKGLITNWTKTINKYYNMLTSIQEQISDVDVTNMMDTVAVHMEQPPGSAVCRYTTCCRTRLG